MIHQGLCFHLCCLFVTFKNIEFQNYACPLFVVRTCECQSQVWEREKEQTWDVLLFCTWCHAATPLSVKFPLCKCLWFLFLCKTTLISVFVREGEESYVLTAQKTEDNAREFVVCHCQVRQLSREPSERQQEIKHCLVLHVSENTHVLCYNFISLIYHCTYFISVLKLNYC